MKSFLKVLFVLCVLLAAIFSDCFIRAASGGGSFFLQESGWPIYTSGSLNPQLLIDDIVPGNNGLEMVVVEDYDYSLPSYSDVSVYSYTSKSALANWPQQVDKERGHDTRISQGDVDLSYTGNEIITLGVEDGISVTDANLFHSDGTTVSGDWPKTFASANNIHAQPIVAEIDSSFPGDEIVALVDGNLYVWHSDGTNVANWPYEYSGAEKQAFASAVGDTDNDGKNEIVAVTQDGSVYVFNEDKSIVSGWPQDISSDVSVNKTYPIIADLNSDGIYEIIIGAYILNDDRFDLYVFEPNGESYPGWNVLELDGHTAPKISVGDIDKTTNELEIVLSFNKTAINNAGIWVYNTGKTLVDGFPYEVTDNTHMEEASIGDINGDGLREILFTGYRYSSPFYYDSRIYVIDSKGNNYSAFPITLFGESGRTPIIMDVDSDGRTEIISQSFFIAGISFEGQGQIMVYEEGDYDQCNIDWPMFRFDNHRSGFYQKTDGCNNSVGGALPESLPATGADNLY